MATIHHLPRPIDSNPLHQQLQGARAAYIDLFQKRVPLLFLLGPPGIGKSTTARMVSERFGQRWLLENPGTHVGMVETIIEHRNDRVLFLDDIDWFWRNSETLNVLKCCTEIGKPHILSYKVGGGKSRRAKVECGFAIHSNIDPNKDSRCHEHIEALKDRAIVHVLSFDPLDLYEYTAWLCSRPGGILSRSHIILPVGSVVDGETITPANRSRQLNLDDANDILRHFAENAARYPTLSPRQIEKFAARRVGRDHETWLKLIEHDLLPKNEHVFKQDGSRIDRLHTYQIVPQQGGSSDDWREHDPA